MAKKINKKIIYGALAVLLVGIILFGLIPSVKHNPLKEKEREKFISLKTEIIGDLMAQGNYKCCLEKPCTYCIEKTPGHGEGATCDCLADVVNGVHPCGECIGEILEGHGNTYLAEYFAKAIAEEVGQQHLNSLKMIISEKYGIAIKEQA